jgi:formylglycine-generating enzyme required for sulfatase activity
VLVDWFDAFAFAAWKGKRLPAEHEWEKAARGPFGRVYPWGDALDRNLANCADYWAQKELPDFDAWKAWWESPAARRAMPNRPGDFEGASAYGPLDMAGNVWEWHDSPYEADQPYRVVRGGSFVDGARFLRSAIRDRLAPGVRNYFVGCVPST